MVGTFAAMANKKFKRVYLAEWRFHANKMTQKDLAAHLGVSDVTVSRWEGGQRNMDVDDLVAIASVLAKVIKMPVDPQDLFRHPQTLSIDSTLRNAPDSLKRQVEAFIKAIRDDGAPK